MMKKINLNDTTAISATDQSDMLRHTREYPAHFTLGRELASRFALPARPERVDEVVILGTGGGSAASAQLLRSFLFDRSGVPITVVQGYNIPGYVDRHSIVIAVSYSGKTEEILSSVSQARERGATLVAIGAGGSLKRLAGEFGAPYLEVPGGFMPRIVLGYILVPILTMMERWGLAPDCTVEVSEAVDLMADLAPEYGPEVPVARNRAKQLAESLGDFIPVIYGASDQLDAVAWRIKNQLGENSKYMGFWNTIPHLHHDEAVGWDMQPELFRHLGFLLLRDPVGETEQTAKRWRATEEILTERAGAVAVISACGTGRLARMMSLVMLGDFFTIYLAIRKGVDPTPVAIIDLFKAKVAQ